MLDGRLHGTLLWLDGHSLGGWGWPPLGLYRLVSYARTDPGIRDRWDLVVRTLRPDERDDEAAHRLPPHGDLVGISCGAWSVRWAARLAERALREHPAALVVLGGFTADTVLDRLPPGADLARVVAVPGGPCVAERVFRDLLRALADRPGVRAPDLAGVPGLRLRLPGGTRDTGPVPPLAADDVPSPYLEGLVPLDPQHDRYLVTCDVACPHDCVFCLMGGSAGAFHGPGWQVGLPRIGAELRHAARSGFRRVNLFGPEIDYSRARLAATLEALPPDAFQTVEAQLNLAHLDDEVVRLLCRVRPGLLWLNVGIQGVGASLGSRVHRRIEGLGAHGDRLRALAARHEVQGDLIAGLPGDRPEDLMGAVRDLRDLGVTVKVHHLRVVHGTALDRDRERFGLQTEEIDGEELVMGHATFPREALQECLRALRAREGQGVHVHSPWQDRAPAAPARPTPAAPPPPSPGPHPLQPLSDDVHAFLATRSLPGLCPAEALEPSGPVTLRVRLAGGDLRLFLGPHDPARPRYMGLGDLDAWYRSDVPRALEDPAARALLEALADWQALRPAP